MEPKNQRFQWIIDLPNSQPSYCETATKRTFLLHLRNLQHHMAEKLGRTFMEKTRSSTSMPYIYHFSIFLVVSSEAILEKGSPCHSSPKTQSWTSHPAILGPRGHWAMPLSWASSGRDFRFPEKKRKSGNVAIWLVVWTPLKNISQLGWLFPICGKINWCSKPPTSYGSTLRISHGTSQLADHCGHPLAGENLAVRKSPGLNDGYNRKSDL